MMSRITEKLSFVFEVIQKIVLSVNKCYNVKENQETEAFKNFSIIIYSRYFMKTISVKDLQFALQ